MSDEKSQQQTSTESTVAGAAKTGKAISNIAKGAAAGGAHGAAIEAGKSSAKWLIPLIAAVLLPLILVAMLPSIIFGSLLGDGTDSPNGISNDEVLVQNMTAINEGISSILSEGLTDVLERIDSDFASSGCDGKEINNPFGADVVFNANAFVSQYCAHKDTEIASISKEDMEALLTANKDKLYSFAFTDEEREIPPEQGDEDSGETIHETIRIYTISYNGEAYFADQVFHLSDDQKLLASQYAQNLTVLLGDGIYQGLSETEFSAMDLSYDGVVFADGETQVVYYNQLDERWKYSPYGTDTIGGYACGPTAMAIWEQEATKPPEELGIRIKQPRKKRKRPTKAEKQLNKNNRKMVPSHKKQVTYSEDFVPVKDIRNGIIETEDGRYIRVLEVEPINFLLRSTSEQKNIVASFASWMKISPIKIQIKVLTKKADIGKHLSTIERDMESESNPKCRELQLDYYRLIQTIGSREAITRRFLVIFEYEAVTNRKPEYSEIVSALETTVQTARQYFLHCDNAVVTHDDENAFLLEILYTIFNRSTCEVKTVEQRIGELQLARRDTDITVPISLKSVLAPDSIDLTHGSYVVMDGVYHAYLIVPSDGYNPRVVAGWTSILVNAGEGIDVDFYFSREPKERIQAKLGQQIRINRSRLKDTSDTNSDFDDFESAIRSGYFLKEGLANYEDFYYCNTLVTVTADTLENLEWRISEVRRLMISQDMDIRICRFRQEQALLSILPFCKLDKKLFEASKRNMLTSSAASCYPFTSFEMSDENGILLGVNQHNNSLVIVDIFNSRVYKNANMVLLGTSGAGKTFTLQLIALRMRRKGTQVFIIAPLKGHEFLRACNNIGGEFISISPASKQCINVCEIRKQDLSANQLIDGVVSENSILAKKIQQLHIFFSLLIPDISHEERQLLDEALIRTYAKKGITHNNESLIDPDHPDRYREMPLLGDVYEILMESPETKRMGNILNRLVNGSAKTFNQHTNVQLDNLYTVLDISELTGELLPVGMFVALDYVWDKAKEDRTKEKAIFIDEAWELIGDDDTNNPNNTKALAGEWVQEIFKIIRGYGGAAIAATQDIGDLDRSRFGKGILNVAKTKIILNLENDEAQRVQHILHLSDAEIMSITRFERGQGLISTNSNHITVSFKASPLEKQLITTDRMELNQILKEKIAQNTHNVVE